MELLHIEDLEFTYPKAEKKALERISLTVQEGEFLVICGESGCGKTTLLKLLKPELAPFGKRGGNIYYQGIPQEKIEKRVQAQEIGYVMQNPDNQIVTDKVWHELAFGLENLGFETKVIRRRAGEMASYFGIQGWFRKNTDELSGGQKQLLNLASVMVMQPKLLILDEPTSQLDPIAAADFIATLQKLNRELGLTILLVEHRLEEVFPIADRVILMENGKILFCDTPGKVAGALKNEKGIHPMSLGLPSAMRIFHELDIRGDCPLTVKEGRNFLQKYFDNKICELEKEEYIHSPEIMLEMKNIWFRYEKELPDVLRGLTFQVYKRELFCILGGNGTGKTTALHVIAGIGRAYRGKIMINGKKLKEYKGNSLYHHMLAFLPQNPQAVFLKNTVAEDFEEILKAMDIEKGERVKKIQQIAEKTGIMHLLTKHPYDISGGEQQKCALAKTLLLEPKLLLLDEPTKGMDANAKIGFGKILRQLKEDGTTIIMVSHDIEFAAETADRCALFFDGEISSVDTPDEFFANNNFYTTAANRIARNQYQGVVTCSQVVRICRKNEVKNDKISD